MATGTPFARVVSRNAATSCIQDFLSKSTARNQHRVYADRPARGQTRGGHTATQGSTRMDPLACRRLGLTQVEVTQLGFGGAGLGDLFEVIPEAQAAATLEAAWDAGIRYYDTAPWYGLTQSEHRFGRALYRQPRRDFVLSTKVGRTMHAVHHAETYDRGFWSGGLPFQVRFDYSYDGVMRSFEDSLQRLGLPRIDLLLIHDLDIQYHQTYKRVEALLTELHNGGARALAELRAAGRIGGFGAGINELGMIPRFLDLIDVDFFLVALPYTLLDQQVLDSEFPRCAEKGIGFVIGAVFASGILATGAVQGARYAYSPAKTAPGKGYPWRRPANEGTGLSVCGLTADGCDRDVPHRRISFGAMPMAFTGVAQLVLCVTRITSN